MGDRYAATGNIAVVTNAASGGDTALDIFSPGTTRRGYLFEMNFSHGATPADTVIAWLVRRLTALGTEGAGVTPSPHDPAAPAATLDAGEGHTVEPTYPDPPTPLFDIDVNQRATFRWVASPGSEFVIPAVTDEGIGMTPISEVYAGIARVTASWEE